MINNGLPLHKFGFAVIFQIYLSSFLENFKMSQELLDCLELQGSASLLQLSTLWNMKPLEVAPLIKGFLDQGVVSGYRQKGSGLMLYQYPAFVKTTETSKPSDPSLLKLIQRKPGLNATQIRKELKISQKLFEKLEAEVLGKTVERKKEGVSWKYFVTGCVETPTPKVPVPKAPELSLEEKLNSLVGKERRELVRTIEQGIKNLGKEPTPELQVAKILRMFGGVPWWDLGQEISRRYGVHGQIKFSDPEVQESLGLRFEYLETPNVQFPDEINREKWFFPLIIKTLPTVG